MNAVEPLRRQPWRATPPGIDDRYDALVRPDGMVHRPALIVAPISVSIPMLAPLNDKLLP